MKYLMILLVAFSSFGCATAIPYSYKERCAMRGMTLTGVSEGSSYGNATAWGSNGPISISSGAYAEAISCEPPKTQNQRCEISRFQKIAEPKANYNEDIATKKIITGTGYMLYIVPGLAAKIIYDGKRSTAIEQSRQIASETESMCTMDEETVQN